MDYRIVYFAFVSANFGGVEQKIIAQFDALQELGAQIHLFMISSFAPETSFAFEIEKRPGVNIFINSPEKIKNQWARRKEKFDLLSSILSDFGPKNTIIYFRYPLSDMLFLRFLKKHRAFKFVTEHQELENKLRLGILVSDKLMEDLFDYAYGKSVRNKITGFVGVSSQYLENQISYLKRNIRNKKYYLINGNGINTSKLRVRHCPFFDGQTLKLLFVGSGYKWHGLHRLLNSMEGYYSSTFKVKIIVHVVGVSLGNTYLKKHLRKPVMRESVVFHGYIPPPEIDKLADECHLAVNSLSLHKIGIKVASTLKSRDYYARGIPFITSSFDDDFEDNNPYILKVSGDENPIDINKLINYASKLNGDPEHPLKMRQFSIEHLSWTVKMKKLINFFDNIIEDTHSPIF